MTRKRAPKIRTFDGAGFWAGSYVGGRAKLLRLAGVPEGEIPDLAAVAYSELPGELRYAIEASGIRKKDLA